MKIRLCPADAERMGVPELVEYDETKLMGREAIAIQKQTGWRPEKLARAMQGEVVRDDAEQIQFAQDADGNDIVDEDTQKRIPLRDIDAEALLIMAWIAVRRAKPTILYADFDLELMATRFGADDGAESAGDGADQGKS